MTAPTHRQYAIMFSFITSILLYEFGLTEINYYLALPVIILVGKHGGLFPDVDGAWKNVKEKTVPNWILNKLIHLTGGRHRSWQTHSIDIVVLAVAISIYLPNKLLGLGILTVVNKEVAELIMLGFCSGWVSHLVSDMMTSEGVRLTCISKFKVKMVPKSAFGIRFNTGNEWESFVYRTVRGINILAGIACIIYPLYDKYGEDAIRIVTGAFNR